MKVFLGGINGVGKTTVIGKVKELKSDLVIVDGAKQFMAWLGFGTDYEKLRALDNQLANQKIAEFNTSLTESQWRFFI